MICEVSTQPTGHIYFARIKGNVKIGYARCVAKRMKEHRGKHGEAEFLFSIRGSFDRERRFHDYFRGLRVDGSEYEQFAMPDSTLALLKDGLRDEPGYKDREMPNTLKATFFLDQATHNTLVELRLKHGVSQQKVFEKALDMYLRSLGYPGIEGAGE